MKWKNICFLSKDRTGDIYVYFFQLEWLQMFWSWGSPTPPYDPTGNKYQSGFTATHKNVHAMHTLH